MQILHLGFWKTGTTGLQRLVFRQLPMPFHGVGSPRSDKSELNRVVQLVRGQCVPELQHLRTEPCVLSHEAGLLLCGGLEGAANLAKAIASGFSDPWVLLTIRNQEDLLASAFFQSFKVRQLSLGFRHNAPQYQAERFTNFSRWWHALAERSDCSLAGLLRYRSLIERLQSQLPPDRIVCLPLEWIARAPEKYRCALLKLGLPLEAINTFLNAPPLNAGAARPLRREWPILRRLEQWLTPESHATKSNRFRIAQILRRYMYGGRVQSVPLGFSSVLQEINWYYEQERLNLN